MSDTLDFEEIGFQMITAAGEAKSEYMEALEIAKTGDFEQAREHIAVGDSKFSEGHNVHTTLIQRECGGDHVMMTLFLTHVEDQMASAETTRLLVLELIELYEKVG